MMVEIGPNLTGLIEGLTVIVLVVGGFWLLVRSAP